MIVPAAPLHVEEPATRQAPQPPPLEPLKLEPQTQIAPYRPAKPERKARWIRRIVVVLAFLLFVFPLLLTLIYRVVPPPITILMVERLVQGHGLSKHWRGLADIAPALPQAVIAAEDARVLRSPRFRL